MTGSIKKNMVLLWENSSPANNFGAQTINLDLSSYEQVRILTNYFNDSTFLPSSGIDLERTVPVNSEIRISSIGPNGQTALCVRLRRFLITTTGIIVGAGETRIQGSATTTNNGSIIPLKIYGIRA